MALRNGTVLILRKPRSGCLEGRTTLIQAIFDFLTTAKAGTTRKRITAPWIGGMTTSDF
jgi:hypothetical protein